MEGGKSEVDDHEEITPSTTVSNVACASSTQTLFVPFQMMECLIEKLKLLDYEQNYCNHNRIKGLSKLYFVIPTNPGEQFNNFVGLAAWLINEAGCPMESPQEFDDPNATIATILESLRSLVGQIPEFPPSKLKSGCGEYCVHVLLLLADAAIKQKRDPFQYRQVDNEEDEESTDSTLDDMTASVSDEGDFAEWMGSKTCISGVVSEAQPGILFASDAAAGSEDDESDFAVSDIRHAKRSQAISDVPQKGVSIDDEPSFIDPHGPFSGLLTGAVIHCPNHNLASETDRDRTGALSAAGQADWQMEVERVMPHLRVPARVVVKDWRSHLEQIKHYHRAIELCFFESRGHLKRLQEDLSRGLDKISSREKYINSQIDRVLTEYRCTQDRLCEIKGEHAHASEGITERSKTLAHLSEEVEKVKREMEQRGSSMTDGSPVVRIKQAIHRLKGENVAMEIRIGVLEHTLLRWYLRAREESQKPLYMRPIGALISHVPLGIGETDAV